MPNVKALERALDILEAFSLEKSELSLSELSRKVNLSPPTVSRLTQTLIKRGYLIQNASNKKYRLSFKLLDLVAIIHASLDLHQTAFPIMSKLRDKLKETVYLDVIEGDERVCIISLPGIHPVRTVVPLGQRSPLYAGADSRMLLASLDDEEIESYLNRVEFKCFASNTITDKEKLWKEIHLTRLMDMAVSVNEFHPGSACISVPIRDYSTKVIAALSVSFPGSRANKSNIENYAAALRKAARSMSEAMGYRQQGKRHIPIPEDLIKRISLA